MRLLLGRRGVRKVGVGAPVSLLDELVQEVDGRPAALGHSDPQLSEVGAGVAGQAPPGLKRSPAHLALQQAAGWG